MITSELKQRDITQNFINGAWVTPSTEETAPVFDSNTGSVIGSSPLSAEADVDAAVSAAKLAQKEWRTLSPSARADYLRAIARELEARHEELSQLIMREVGANQEISRGSQTLTPIASFNIAADILESYNFVENIGDNLVMREPIGVVGAITAWNFPLHLVTVKAAFAIAAGNTIVIKPSEVAPLTAAVLAEAVQSAKLPNGVINIVFGSGPDVGEAIVTHPDVAMLTFTGSTKAGMRIGALAAQKVAKVALELGGKSPLVILPDAPLQEAVEFGVGDLLLNNGQRCDGLTRMIVPKSLLPEVERIARETMDAVLVGPSTESTSEVGPLVSKTQQDRVLGYIDKGISEGAKLVTGGTDPIETAEQNSQGYFVRPTVFSEVTNDMAIGREEIFGPVLSIQSYSNVDQAVEIANGTEYGLHAAVFGSDIDAALSIAARLEAGMVTVNGGESDIRAPFGGYKHSGIGREFGRYGFEEFLEIKAVRVPKNFRN
ncbi:aldehyde dehydrogenase family protein [Paramicrobacterium fandaimingii]|uniref:aldehyde dehydrogenase family protein n=1 Tax=Paramicrobacterium fandaimingii TaxID=2708079 RepID=UPI001AB0377C|nr:aldehyde dehydrogenase family protein [Microbacterium fandaimingii]